MRSLSFILLFTALSFPLLVTAQPRAEETRPADVQAAAAAFGEGQRAQLRGDYAQAADLFELADRSAPSAAALRSAIRSRIAAGHRARAATLSADALARHGSDAETRTLAEEVIAGEGPTLARLRVSCTPACSLAVDGRAVRAAVGEAYDLFVDPGTRRLVASWPERDAVEQELELVAGTERSLELRAPEAAAVIETPVTVAPMDDVIVAPVSEPEPAPRSGGISPAVFVTGAGLTAVALGLGIGFGIDTLAARDAYEADPTREGYEDGVSRQWVTNGFLFGAAALGVATAVIAIFTDWDGEPENESRALRTIPWMIADQHGAVVGVSHTFGGDT